MNLRGAFYTPYSLSRGAPSATWVLPQMSKFFSRCSIWRREWDSNPRMLSHRRFSRPVLSTTQPSLRAKKQFSRQTRVLYYHAGGTLSTKRPARNLKKTKNRACKPAKTVVFLVGYLRKLHIRVWRSLVSRLNGVQEASSSNLDTRTKLDKSCV